MRGQGGRDSGEDRRGMTDEGRGRGGGRGGYDDRRSYDESRAGFGPRGGEGRGGGKGKTRVSRKKDKHKLENNKKIRRKNIRRMQEGMKEENEKMKKERKEQVEGEEELNTDQHQYLNNEERSRRTQRRGDEAAEEQSDNTIEGGSTSYSYTDSRASIEGHMGNTEEEDTEGSERYDTDTDTNTNTLYSEEDEVTMTYWDEHRIGFPPVDVMEEKKECYICGRTSTAGEGMCKGCGFEIREMIRKEDEEEGPEEKYTYIKMKVTHGTTGRPNTGIAINTPVKNRHDKTNTCKECGIVVKRPEKSVDTTKWDKIIPQLWQNKIGRFRNGMEHPS